MSVDRSLKLKGALARHRNVLTRAERVERLKEEERWQEGDKLFGLPKVANRKVSVGKKKAEAKAEGEALTTIGADGQVTTAAPGTTAAPAAGKAGAPAGKAATPAGKAATAAPSKIKAAPVAKSSGQGKPGGGGGGRR